MLLPLLHTALAACRRAADAEQATHAAWPDVSRFLASTSPNSQLHILATGKASVPTARAALVNIVAHRLANIIITCPPEHEEAARALHALAQVFPCDHPLPTARNVAAAHHILTFAQSIPPTDTLLVLLSGGASAHLCLPVAGISLTDLITCTQALQRSGATIRELNAVRKHVERLKGGQLARACRAHSLVTCILSDVLPNADGSPALVTIASGPTVPDSTTYAQALHVLQSRNLTQITPSITAHLERGVQALEPETPKSRKDFNTSTHEIVIGSNALMLDAAATFLTSQGVHIHATKHAIEGEASNIAEQLVSLMHAQAPLPGIHALILGGEWTVNATNSTGIGGPSQELALATLLRMPPNTDFALLTYSSDGIDGPTSAAGAIVTSAMLANAASTTRAQLQTALTNHDSHTALANLNALITTGPTGTNVNHIAVVLWQTRA